MMQEITSIGLSLRYRFGDVNCYLIRTNTGYVLIDTGASNSRVVLEKELGGMGCKPGNLKLVILTHGDFDHTGNAAYLRSKFGTTIAMHRDDSGMAECGDLFCGRRRRSWLIRMIAPILFGFGKSERFQPDLYVEDGYDLSGYGLDAKVISIPGHSRGSIGVLTSARDLFCGDLLINSKKPVLNSIIDDPVASNDSIQKLRNLGVNTVYPGHGKAFAMELLAGNR
jgi:hydroxyacylglutathione hydrolase